MTMMQDLGYGFELDDGTPIKDGGGFYFQLDKSPVRPGCVNRSNRDFDRAPDWWAYSSKTGICYGDMSEGKDMFTVRPVQPTGPDAIEEMFS